MTTHDPSSTVHRSREVETAARGVVHSEMPEQENGAMQGFQLWLNLPARDKMRAPTYCGIPATEISVFTDARACA